MEVSEAMDVTVEAARRRRKSVAALKFAKSPIKLISLTFERPGPSIL
jgi:hypothetical protein